MKMKKWLNALVVAGALVSMVGTASAHVTVWPKTTTTGAYEKYTVRVPVEKQVNTTKVKVVFPAGVKVNTVEPMTGWNYAFEKDSSGNTTSLTWTATAGGIKPNEFMEFSFVGANPKTPGTISWKAYQTYADGNVVEWTGAPGSDTPASVTTITAGGATDDHHDDNKTTTTTPEQQQTAAGKSDATTTTTSSNTVPYILSGAALLLALVSLFRKR
ncbi:MAG: YcnI family copper-binding membrane protein [Tumebacillaceae bacterium]